MNHIRGIYSGFPWANHLALPGSESIFGLSPEPPMFVCASLSQDEFQQRCLWVGWHHLLWSGALSLWPSKRLSVSCVVGKVFWTFRMRNMWSFISYLGRDQPCLLLLLLRNFCPQGTNSSCSSWGPSISCLKFLPERCEPTRNHYRKDEGWRSV